jgi:SWI/SNF-related matrix-associated actin-dependent regulator 1 of chromatin subfamily A
MQLIHQNNRFILQCTYDQRDVAKVAGFRWDPKLKHWWTDRVDYASRVLHFASGVVKEQLRKFAQEQDDLKSWSLEMSTAAKTGNFHVPVPEGQKLDPFQIVGVQYMNAHPFVLNADDPGLGKTIQVYGLINKLNLKRVLIIAPATATFNWLYEAGVWLTEKRSVAVAGKEFPVYTDIVIMSYSKAPKYEEYLYEVEWDLLVCDESHNLKNAKAQRTQSILGGTRNHPKKIIAKRIAFLTGTPILNGKPTELWTTVKRLDPRGLGSNWASFHNTYCDPKESGYGTSYGGASNVDELNRKLRESIMIRRRKVDVLAELPPKRRQIITLDSSSVKSLVQAEMGTYQKSKEEIHRLKNIAEHVRDDEIRYRDAIRHLRIQRNAMFEEISRYRAELAVKKIPFCLEHLANVLTPDNKVVFFAHHKALVQAVYQEFGDLAVCIHGGTEAHNRKIYEQEFQNNPYKILFVGNMIAAGVSLTLTASSHVVCGEFDWRPSIVTQAEDRTWRRGQKNAVNVQHLVFDGSLDALMAKKIVKKQEIFDAVVDGIKIVSADEAEDYLDD